MRLGSVVWILLTSPVVAASVRAQVPDVVVVVERATSAEGRELERDFAEALRARFGGEVQIEAVRIEAVRSDTIGGGADPSELLERARAVVTLEGADVVWWTDQGPERGALSPSLRGFDLAREAAHLAHLALRERLTRVPDTRATETDDIDTTAAPDGISPASPASPASPTSPTSGERGLVGQRSVRGQPRARLVSAVDVGLRFGGAPAAGARVALRLAFGRGSFGVAAEALVPGQRDEETNRRRHRVPIDVQGRFEALGGPRGALQIEASLGLVIVRGGARDVARGVARDEGTSIAPTLGGVVAPSLRIARGLSLELPIGVYVALASNEDVPRFEGRLGLGVRFE